MHKFIITGSRYWKNEARIRATLARAFKGLPPDEIVVCHGAHYEGADDMVDLICRDMGIVRKPYAVPQSDWRLLGRKAGPLRNRRMVKENLDAKLCIAFWDLRREGCGTFDCFCFAAECGLPVFIVSDPKLKIAA